MYYELIYTRCRQGIDILKDGRPILNDGYKVYSCSQKLMDGNVADLPLLFHLAQSKQTCSDPDFMDDAYIYATPDKGQNIMVNFHPIPFDKNAKGDYSHRPGNFINQIFVGGYKEFYLYEFFGNSETWNAKTRGEAFYYENAPQSLPEREDLARTGGAISSEDIARFVADGRQGAVKAAIAFIVEQYRLSPEERRYIVIRDEYSSYLELWIAAIESAFSPRMASGLPFATRMDKFVTLNRYTVNMNGVYQTQINLQDPKQKQRLRAMLVGVDERDRTNAASIRPLPNAPYVVLDGKSKKLDYAADTSFAYFSLVTSYDERHSRFCREFLQMLDICQPTVEILRLYDAYVVLDGISADSSARKIADSLAILEKQSILSCEYFHQLYSSIKAVLPRCFKENSLYAFMILKWLEKAAPIANDTQACDAFHSIVSAAFADCVYNNPRHEDTADFWTSIRNSGFAATAASHLISNDTFESYKNATTKYDVDVWLAFFQIFLPCAVQAHSYTVDGLYMAVRSSIDVCDEVKEYNKALQICAMVSKQNTQIFKDLLLKFACEAGNSKAAYYIWLLLRTDAGLTHTNKATVDLVHFLQQQKQEHLCSYVLEYKAKSLGMTPETESFLSMVLSDPTLKGFDLSKIYIKLDSKLQLDDKSGMPGIRMATLLQETRDEKIACPVSAHICALNVLKNKSANAAIIQKFKSYAAQGFPCIEDKVYATKLVKELLTCRLPGNEFAAIIKVLICSPFYHQVLLQEMIGTTTEKNCDGWNILIDILAKEKNEAMAELLTAECMASKKSDKQLAQLQGMLNSRKAQDYFSLVLADIQKKREASAPKLGFGRLFGFGGREK